jgi:mRNA-degrading endonuclease YafQ of YafQ-DinJ toxin-antitoxin module
MREFVWDKSFRSAFRRTVQQNPLLKRKIFLVLSLLEADPHTPALQAQPLTGELKGLSSCWVDQDCRIIYTIKHRPDFDRELILLVDISRADEAY